MFSRSKFDANLDKALSTGSNRKLKANVYARFLDGPETVAIQLYDTVITQVSSDGATVNLGGWDTVSTRSVLATVLRRYGMDVYRDKGVTYFSNGTETVELPRHGIIFLPFRRKAA